eukprot:354296-Chlamydomonas_euryale.AAC.2
MSLPPQFGDIVPADIKILAESDDAEQEETPMQIDQAALTGESLPVKKFSGDVAFSGSAIKVRLPVMGAGMPHGAAKRTPAPTRMRMAGSAAPKKYGPRRKAIQGLGFRV